MVEELTKSQVKMLERVFQGFDKGKTGKISTDEIYDMMEQIGAGLNKIAIQQMIQEVDTWATGELDFHAFATLASRFIVEEDPNKLRDELRQAFLFFDRDGNGYITTDQLREILWELDNTIGVSDMDQIIEEIDADGSGTVDFEEFLAVMMGGEEEKEKKFVGE
ncbi:troponin C, isoallergen Bla g 6.0101-like [Thrips palmi]|uniref:Troponin C, isoallergen Bla g 6.0101-like n=1 Tax=Thrips palmi TaxID=161013 RepID=A0A6P8YBH4_THRPL|nr:troponin C, isoallergen Bla g 6.0101-like [Thrips palmi]